jgi:hypothetical protein
MNNLDDVLLDSSRDNTDLAVSNNTASPDQCKGISVFRFWQDNWKAVGRWNLISKLPIIPSFGNAIILAGPVIGAPTVFRTKFIYVPVMVEVDRPTEISVIARNIFESTSVSIKKNLRARTAEIIEIGPFLLENFYDSRYFVRIIDGLRSPIELIFSAHKSNNEFNFIVTNCDKNSKENSPSSDFIYDISRRNKIPFNGIALNISLNVNIQFRDIIASFVSKPEVVHALMQNRDERELSSLTREILNSAIECMQEEIRIYFSRPSHAEFLKTGFHVVLPARGEYLERNRELPRGMPVSEIIFWLIAERLIQEYFWQVLDPFENVFYYQVDEGLRKSPRQSDRAEEVFLIWKKNAKPYFKPSPTGPIVAPNRLSSIEFVPELTEDTIPDVSGVIEDEPIDEGVRVIIMYPLDNFSNCAEAFLSDAENEAREEFKNKILSWMGSKFDRAVSIIVPCTLYGTKTIPSTTFVDESMSENFTISFVDSVYKNNETRRSAKYEEGKAAIIKSRVAGGGKSKRAQEKKLEEERQQAEKLQADIDALIAELGPDGYIVVECRVYYFTPPPPNDIKVTVATVGHKILGSVPGGFAAEQELYLDIESLRPSPLNYIQVKQLNIQYKLYKSVNFIIIFLISNKKIQPPDWLEKFVPANLAGVFVHDEVTLLMRQDKDYFYVLKEIEETENPMRPTMFHNIRDIYLSSRLCDLSRPPELREIDTNIVGVKELFLSELLQEIWDKAVPDYIPETTIEMKTKIAPIYDDFVKGFCLSRTMKAENVLENADLFTKAVLEAMVVSVTIMYSLKMFNEKSEEEDEDGHQKFRWEFIRNGIEIVDIEGEESDIEDLDNEEEKIIQDAIAAEEKAAEDERLRILQEEAAALAAVNASLGETENAGDASEKVDEKDDEKKSDADNTKKPTDGADAKKADLTSTSAVDPNIAPQVVEEEPDAIATISKEELVSETRDFLRNNYTDKLKARRAWGQKILFQSSPY